MTLYRTQWNAGIKIYLNEDLHIDNRFVAKIGKT